MSRKKSVCLILSLALLAGYYFFGDELNELFPSYGSQPIYADEVKNVEDYDGVHKYVVINNNEPYFNEDDITFESYETYSNLDRLGRASVAVANIGFDLMPTEDRGEIGNVKPSGFQTVKYDFISGKYLYNRCHLIGYQLTAENANELNLITCTRSTNTGFMLELENKVAQYIKETKNHVLYRVTPIYKDDELVARGILMEAYSVEDKGKGIKFNYYLYNVEDGVSIDYKTGESKLANTE